MRFNGTLTSAVRLPALLKQPTRIMQGSLAREDALLINTPLQRGDPQPERTKNRFNGFYEVWETVETVAPDSTTFDTLLKPMVSTQVPSLPARNEWGERRREGKLNKSASSPRPSPPSCVRRRGRKPPAFTAFSDLCRYHWLKRGVNERTICRSKARHEKFKIGLAMWVRAFLLLAFIAAFVRPTEIHAQSASQREYEIKAAYLYNFINYIDWAADALPPAGGTITIGIVGECPYATVFDPLNGKQTKGRKLAVKQVASAKDLEQCQIVFICASEKSRLSEYLGQLKDAKLLTVGEIDGFAEQGGVINFISERNKVRFEINPEAARRAGLTISSELLKLAKLVKP